MSARAAMRPLLLAVLCVLGCADDTPPVLIDVTELPDTTDTIGPFIHDADRYTFGAGGSWKHEQLRLDFNVRYVAFRASSTLGINRYDYNGSYETGGLQAGASLGYRF